MTDAPLPDGAPGSTSRPASAQASGQVSGQGSGGAAGQASGQTSDPAFREASGKGPAGTASAAPPSAAASDPPAGDAGSGPTPPFDFDAAYRLLALAHRDLDAEASAALNARLVLLLAAECADLAALARAVETARRAGQAAPGG